MKPLQHKTYTVTADSLSVLFQEYGIDGAAHALWVEVAAQDSRQGNDEVAAIYAMYPRKVGRPAAIKAIAKAVKAYGHAKVAAATQAYAEAVRKAKQDPAYIPHPATWYNQERFNDAPDTWVRVAAAPAWKNPEPAVPDVNDLWERATNR